MTCTGRPELAPRARSGGALAAGAAVSTGAADVGAWVHHQVCSVRRVGCPACAGDYNRSNHRVVASSLQLRTHRVVGEALLPFPRRQHMHAAGRVLAKPCPAGAVACDAATRYLMWMQPVTFRRFRLALLPVMLLLAWPVAQAQGLAAPVDPFDAASGRSQQTLGLDQAQNLQRQLSPVTGDMARAMAPSRSSGNGSNLPGGTTGLGLHRLHGRRGVGGTSAPWADQAQQLQRQLAGGASSLSMDGSISSLTSAVGTHSPWSTPPPSAGGRINNPYAGGGSVPGANSPYTSAGNAAGVTPYRQPYGLNSLGSVIK